MNSSSKYLLYYTTKAGESPFIKWFESLDHAVEQVVRSRLERVKNGNCDDYKSLGDGVFELRIHFGAGYRIYYGIDGVNVILLLCGGDKSTQIKDIKRAKSFLEAYKNENRK